jgi:radical SAM superfamily enzyme YgiQ (UPF0313 family)
MANCIILSGAHIASFNLGVVHRPLGPYRVASCLNDAGYTTYVFDFISKFTIDEIIETLKNQIGPDTLWIGLSSTFFVKDSGKPNSQKDIFKISLDEMYWGPDYVDIIKFFNFIKQYKNIKIVYGGAKTPYSMLDSNIDYYVLGYADVAVIDLTDYLSGKKDTIDHVEEIKTLDGLTSYKIESQKYPEPDINNISTHWWNKSFNVLPGEILPIELARGCIFKCKFCSYPLLGKKKGTYLRSSSQIRDELIKMYEVHGTTGYYITDDTFNDDNDKIEELHKIFTSLPFKPQFSCYLRLDLINKFPHQAELLSEMGLIGTFFGLETLNHDSGKAIGKGLHPNKVKDRLYWLHDLWKNKVNTSAGFILGLPYDTQDYFYDLISWCLEDDNPVQEIIFNPLHLADVSTFPEDRQSVLKRLNFVSEFSLNPKIYGYEFEKNQNSWKLPSQNLTFNECKNIANSFTDLVYQKNKVAAFGMSSLLNIGISLDDLYNLTIRQLVTK